MRQSVKNAALILISFASHSALACVGPSGVDFYPSCRVPVAAMEDELVIVKIPNDHGSTAASSVIVTIGDQRDIPIGIIDLDIRATAKPLYLVLSSFDPVIWRLHGAIDSLSRVVAFGSLVIGADAVGIIGVPREKIVFPIPDFHSFAQGRNYSGFMPSMCDGVAKACTPESFLFRYPASENDRSAVINLQFSPLKSAMGTLYMGETTAAAPQGFTTVEAGPAPAAYFDVPQLIDGSAPDLTARVSVRPRPSAEQTVGSVAIMPGDVVSPMPIVFH